MTDTRINHYYVASIISFGFSKSITNNKLRRNNVNVISIPDLIKLLENFKGNCDLVQYLKNNESQFLKEKEANDIFTSKDLKEENDSDIQNLESCMLFLLKKGLLNENYEIKKEEEEVLINFIKLCLKRSILLTDNFSKENLLESEINKLTFGNSEWCILESENDCAAISDLNPISILYINEEVINKFKIDKKFNNECIFFAPFLSNKLVAISSNKELMNEFIEKFKDADFKTNIFNFLFCQILMFSLYYIVVGNNKWIIDLIVTAIADEKTRKKIVYKRKNEYQLINYYKKIHNLKK